MIRFAFGCTLLATVLTPALELAAAQDRGKGNNYALLVGCSSYLKTEFSQLPYSGNDVLGFREALLKTGFPDAHVVVLHEATKEPARFLPQKANILKAFDLFLDGMGEQDTVVIALSGHGIQWKGDPVSYFVPVEGKVNDKSTLIALTGKDGLYERLKQCKARQKLVILNAPRNDPTVAGNFGNGINPMVDEDRIEVPDGIAAIYSCQAGQKSYYDHERKLSLFFDHVIRAWKGEYSSGSELTLDKFFVQVMVKTRLDADKTYRVSQTPLVQREYAGRWVIPTAVLAKPSENEQLLASEFAEFTRFLLIGKDKAELWLEQHGAARLGAWREGADGGSPEAMNLLGNCLDSGKVLAKNHVQAVKWYRKSAELGNAWGQFNLAVMYNNGRGVAKDEAEAGKWYRKSAEQSNPWAQNELGRMYQNGRGVAKDEVQAVRWYRKAADQGYATAQNNVGWMYENARGVPQDHVEAFKWYRKSAEQGNAAGQSNIARMYENGLGVAKNEAEALNWYRKAAEHGDPVAQNKLGWMYQDGRGVARDDVEAFRWYRKSADQGYATAQNNLGWMYENGLGGAQNIVEAFKWYRKAAEQGNAAGQNNLGWMYAQGRGVAKDYAEAIKWYRKSADQGYASAQNNLGEMYENGRGVAQNLSEAVRWYRLASSGGNQSATDALRRLGKQ